MARSLRVALLALAAGVPLAGAADAAAAALSGRASGRAVLALRSVAPTEPLGAGDILHSGGARVARREVVVLLRDDATVRQVNDLVARLHGTIAASVQGAPLVVIAIPDPGSAAGLEAAVAAARFSPGVAVATTSPLVAYQALPPGVASPPPPAARDDVSHLLASGVAAAWNLRRAMQPGGLPAIVVADAFAAATPPRHLAVDRNEWQAHAVAGPIDHGDLVAGVIAADHRSDGSPGGRATGVLPVQSVVVPLDVAHTSLAVAEIMLVQTLDAIPGRIVVNTSIGASPALDDATSAAAGLGWVDLMRAHGLDGRVVQATAAGNGKTRASAASPWAAALRADLRGDDGAKVEPLTNTLAVENATELADASGLGCRATSSNAGGTVAAPGRDVLTLGADDAPVDESGTSMASPVVAGVAAYLWSLAPDLDASAIVAVIRANARRAPSPAACGDRLPTAPLIDAWAAALSLDEAAAPSVVATPIRLALLDANDDGVFTAGDLERLAPAVASSHLTATRTWGRADLNGDGYVGGGATAPFDLDRTGSTRGGAPHLEVVPTRYEGRFAQLDERAATDADVLCYYAYSPLYSGSAARRTALLDRPGLCVPDFVVDAAVLVPRAAASATPVAAQPGGTKESVEVARLGPGTRLVKTPSAVATGGAGAAGQATVEGAVRLSDDGGFEHTLSVSGSYLLTLPKGGAGEASAGAASRIDFRVLGPGLTFRLVGTGGGSGCAGTAASLVRDGTTLAEIGPDVAEGALDPGSYRLLLTAASGGRSTDAGTTSGACVMAWSFTVAPAGADGGDTGAA